MNIRSIVRPIASSTLAGLVALVLSACILPGNVGDDPESGSGEDTGGSVGDFATTTSTTSSASHTSADPSGAGTVTTVTTAATATVGPLDPQGALDFCEVPVDPPPPEGPVYMEFLECEGGCTIELELDELINLFDNYGDCLCAAMDCGIPVGGGGGGPAPDGSTSDPTDTGETDGSDGCGPFPPGDEGFTCSCEMCSIDVTNVEADWLNDEADLGSICECMCGNTGCGMPV